MAKRRNVKKEKAARNRAYARQFQKKSGRGAYKGNRFASNKTEQSSDKEADSKEE